MSKEKIYDNEIAELMTQIIKKCQESDIAMFAHFRLDKKNDGDQVLCTTSLPISDLDNDNVVIKSLKGVAVDGNPVVPNLVATTTSKE